MSDPTVSGFPLDVTGLLVIPKVSKTGPWQHISDDQKDNQSLPVVVRTPAGAILGDAVVVLPYAYAELAVGQPYQLLAPSSIRANVDPERLTPHWIIDSRGLTLAPAIQTPLLTPHVDLSTGALTRRTAIEEHQKETSAPEAKESLTIATAGNHPATRLDRREEMRIREAAAKAITRLEQARSIGNRNRGREVLDQLGKLLQSAPSDKFGYELRQYDEYSTWLRPARKKNRSQFGRGR
ncbi:hypothetical protein ACFYUK_43925 [Nonomuraea wenchangensis]